MCPGATRCCGKCRYVSAMTDRTLFVDAANRLDTVLMEATAGRIIAKAGAEGVWNRRRRPPRHRSYNS
ncbi:MAG: asparaginase [Bacillota bacterium]